ncbi:hypothetical protein HDR60_00825 [bacterium]|nr:hypothetical protein [bacterium]
MKKVNYIWIADNGGKSCDTCKALHLTEYTNIEDVPEKPHPNCRCIVKDVSGLAPDYLTQRPWSGKDADKTIWGDLIYEKPNGERELHPPKHPMFSRESMEVKEWEREIEKKLYTHLLPEMEEEIKKLEDIKTFGYADTKGNVTIGAGNMIAKKEDMVKLNLVDPKTEIEVTDERKMEEYDKIITTRNKLGKNGPKNKPYNYKAEKYKRDDYLIIREEEINEKVKDHLYKDLDQVKAKFKDFLSYPYNVKKVLLDMEYNMGKRFHDGNDKDKKETGSDGWPEFFKAIRARDWKKAAEECTSDQIGKDRNKWRVNMLKTAK